MDRESSETPDPQVQRLRLRRILIGTCMLLVIGLGGIVFALYRHGPPEELIPENVTLKVGMNLLSVTDYSPEWTFVDVFKSSRPWISQNVAGTTWDDNRPIATTPEGWPLLSPGQAVATLMCDEFDGHYPPGNYICTYAGDGDLAFGNDARIAKQAPGRIELGVAAGKGGILLRITRSNPKDPVRDIHVWMPGFENAKSPFHPLYLERLRPFGVIRFMDWGGTNNSPLVHWADRTTPASCRQSGPRGVAVEYMIELCNELGADPWICIPHLADDDFSRNFARLVKERLKPDRRIYVEWSNEAWNGMFTQGQWLEAEARRRSLKFAPWVTADEAKRHWQVWHEVFGAEKGRVVRVACGQHYNPWVLEQILERLEGDCDAVSCAAYFATRDEDNKRFERATSGQEIVESILHNIEEHDLPNLVKHKILAQHWSRKLNRHIPLVAYEGGQHLTANGREDLPYARALLAAQGHPLMGEAYAKMLKGFRELGGELFLAYGYCSQPSKWGSWGHLEYMDQPLNETPKFQALLDAIKTGGAK